jgi:hypothetical protein
MGIFMNGDLEKDLSKTDWIIYKCKNSKKYSQNLYAALCNNRFFKDNQEWTCSWRYSGGLVADLIGEGDYMDWYCSGIGAKPSIDIDGYVGESCVTEEVRNDLLNLGWVIKPYERIPKEKQTSGEL